MNPRRLWSGSERVLSHGKPPLRAGARRRSSCRIFTTRPAIRAQDHDERHREPLAPEPELFQRAQPAGVGLGGHRKPGLDRLLHRVDLEGVDGRARLDQVVPGSVQIELGLADLHARPLGPLQEGVGLLQLGPERIDPRVHLDGTLAPLVVGTVAASRRRPCLRAPA